MLIAFAVVTATPIGAVGTETRRPCVAVQTPLDARRVGTPPTEAAAKEDAIDPVRFFRELVERYRGLLSYADSVHMTQTVTRDGEAKTVETEFEVRVDDEGLEVKTPARQLTRGLGISVPTSPGSPIAKARGNYDLWLAPHMKLRYADEPLDEFREGIEEGFTAAEAEPVTIDETPMIHITLKSGDGLSEDSEAEFDLYVNSESMLVERIEGAQRLPDGGSVETTLDITPTEEKLDPRWPAMPSAGDDLAPVG
jgi:hypothetical protein